MKHVLTSPPTRADGRFRAGVGVQIGVGVRVFFFFKEALLEAVAEQHRELAIAVRDVLLLGLVV